MHEMDEVRRSITLSHRDGRTTGQQPDPCGMRDVQGLLFGKLNAKGHEGRCGQRLPQMRQHHARKVAGPWPVVNGAATRRRDRTTPAPRPTRPARAGSRRSRAIAFDRADAGATRGCNRRLAGWIAWLGFRITARSMTFRSSQSFSGQPWPNHSGCAASRTSAIGLFMPSAFTLGKGRDMRVRQRWAKVRSWLSLNLGVC